MYDEEIGYCQGQSFLAAVLLLHVSAAFTLSWFRPNNKYCSTWLQLLHFSANRAAGHTFTYMLVSNKVLLDRGEYIV